MPVDALMSFAYSYSRYIPLRFTKLGLTVYVDCQCVFSLYICLRHGLSHSVIY